MKPAIVFGIETSCDETACAVVRDGREVLSSVVRSQVALHAPFGGVVPEIASRSHVEEMTHVVRLALDGAGIDPTDITAIAVTSRPGLIGSLVIGLTAAKVLAFAWSKPLLTVDHLHAHTIGALMGKESVPLPAVALVVSGGHTSLLEVTSPLVARTLGSTTDDAAGEAFDKVAQLLELGYPGGPAVAQAAAGGNPAAVPFPRTMLGPDSLDFSFSGLKTAVLYLLRGQQGRRPVAPIPVCDIAASFQEAVVDTLILKCERALARTGHRTLLVGGGVAANGRLRAKLAGFAERNGIHLAVAKPEFCTDNAAMVAALGCLMAAAGLPGAGGPTEAALSEDAEPGSSLP